MRASVCVCVYMDSVRCISVPLSISLFLSHISYTTHTFGLFAFAENAHHIFSLCYYYVFMCSVCLVVVVLKRNHTNDTSRVFSSI